MVAITCQVGTKFGSYPVSIKQIKGKLSQAGPTRALNSQLE